MQLGSQKTNAVPFCDDCPHAVDFGPWVSTPIGTLPTKVKFVEGQVACVNCPHHQMRESALSAQDRTAA